MRILGIDPGLASVGYGVIEKPDSGNPIHLAHGVIETSPKVPLAKRLDKIYRELSKIIRQHRPDETAVEDLFFAANVKTAIGVAQGRGVAILATAQSKCELFEYTPLQIKQAVVGYGRASKKQVQQMVKAILGLDEIPKPDHAADALAAALCHVQYKGPLLKIAKAEMESREGESFSENPNKLLLAQRKKSRRRR